MAKKKGKKKSAEMLVVQSKAKDYVRDKGFRVSGEFMEALSDEVADMLDAAMDRADTNKRKTLYAGDL